MKLRVIQAELLDERYASLYPSPSLSRLSSLPAFSLLYQRHLSVEVDHDHGRRLQDLRAARQSLSFKIFRWGS